MSATIVETSRRGAAGNDRSRQPPGPPRRWMINSWVDALLILLTPLVAIPAVLLLYSPQVGIKAETIGLIVTAFFATGHHLPGLIRAYGDRELFERFRWRFLLAPPLVFLAYFPLYTYHFDLYRLIILFWATWHGLMQLYGFVRIYDSKVGSTSTVTAYWDWLVCLCGFILPNLLRPELLSKFLDHWYSSGGPLISASTLSAVRSAGLGISFAVLVGFAVNYIMQTIRGPRPNPLKLVMLASGIGMWWFAMMYIENLILGVALFDICHDVQYLAIVWLYNCRRVSSNPQLGGFMRYIFRRGMVLLYLGLITAYGALGLVAPLVLDGTVSQIAYAVLFTSTILHYYYDGFIWKVREPANRANLGLDANAPPSRVRQFTGGPYAHALKWAPAVIGLGILFADDLTHPSLTKSQKDEITRTYAQSLMPQSKLPDGDEQTSWLYSRFEQTLNIADAVPGDRKAQLRAAIMLANFGQKEEAVRRLDKLIEQYPTYHDAHLMLGEVHLQRGELSRASGCFDAALSHAQSDEERSLVCLKQGQLALLEKDIARASEKFRQAVKLNSELAASIEALSQGKPAPAPTRNEFRYAP